MLSVYFSVLLVACGIALGVGLPWISVHLGELRARESEHVAELHRQRRLIAEHEATIAAYRQAVRENPDLSLTTR